MVEVPELLGPVPLHKAAPWPPAPSKRILPTSSQAPSVPRAPLVLSSALLGFSRSRSRPMGRDGPGTFSTLIQRRGDTVPTMLICKCLLGRKGRVQGWAENGLLSVHEQNQQTRSPTSPRPPPHESVCHSDLDFFLCLTVNIAGCAGSFITFCTWEARLPAL